MSLESFSRTEVLRNPIAIKASSGGFCKSQNTKLQWHKRRKQYHFPKEEIRKNWVNTLIIIILTFDRFLFFPLPGFLTSVFTGVLHICLCSGTLT